MFENAEFIEWITAAILLPLLGWAIYVQHQISTIRDELDNLQGLLQMILQNTAITRGKAES